MRDGEYIGVLSGARELEGALTIDEITLECFQCDRMSGRDLELFHAGPFVLVSTTF